MTKPMLKLVPQITPTADFRQVPLRRPAETRPNSVDQRVETNDRHQRHSPRKGEGPSPGALRQRRYRARRKRVTRNVTPVVTPPAPAKLVTPAVTPVTLAGIDLAAYAAAVALAGAAAWSSVRGMTVLFPGAPLSVTVMAVAMEGSKLVTAGWLARRWRVTSWIWRLTLVTLVAGLAIINAAGVYAQLVAAHVGERGEAAAAVEMQDAALAARAEVARQGVADLDRRIGQIDLAIEEAARRGRTVTALTAIESQRRARAELVDERRREAGALGRTADRARQRGRPRQDGGIGGGADPIRGRRLRRHRSGDGNPVADPGHGAVL
jgi:hypothetical protein